MASRISLTSSKKLVFCRSHAPVQARASLKHLPKVARKALHVPVLRPSKTPIALSPFAVNTLLRSRVRPPSPPKCLRAQTADLSGVSSLLENGRVATLEELQNCSEARKTILVGLDVEGREGQGSQGVNSIGLASLVHPQGGFGLDSMENPTATCDLAELVERYTINGNNFDCIPYRKKKPEPFLFGQGHQVDKKELEKGLMNKLEDIKKTHQDEKSGAAPDIMLVVYQYKNEFDAMSNLFPNVAQHISNWVDVASLTADGICFSLTDTMRWLGLDNPQYLQSKRRHSPRMDAVRTLGVLIQLVSSHGLLPDRARRHENRPDALD